MTPLADVAASVARVFDLTARGDGWYWAKGDNRILLELAMNGSDLDIPEWRCRCLDWLLERGDVCIHHFPDSHHWFYSCKGEDVRIGLLCPANEFAARAIHELVQRGEV